MPRLSFEIEWVDAAGIKGEELSATSALLWIRAGDSTVTRILDARAKTVRDFVHVSVYPLAEWLATNWWFLTHEFGNPVKERCREFLQRHSLGANREGYAFPALEAVPAGSRTRLTWKRDRLHWARVEFLEQGEMWVDSDEFRECCTDLINTVIERLNALGVNDTLLQEEWDAIQSADEDETRFCQTAAGLGWYPYDLDEPDQLRVIQFAERLGALLGEAVPAVIAEGPQEDWSAWSAIPDAVSKTRKSRSIPLHRIQSFGHEARADAVGEPRARYPAFTDVPVSRDAHPWDVGYEYARRLRQHLELDGQPLPNLTRIAAALGEDIPSIRRVTKPPASASAWPALVDGVVTRSDDGSPAIALRRPGVFPFCRALAEVLLSPGLDVLLTRARSERQQRNRAFAAEFLAPSTGLRNRISQPVVDADDVDKLAVEFGVSPRTIEHQIVNHEIARVAPRTFP